MKNRVSCVALWMSDIQQFIESKVVPLKNRVLLERFKLLMLKEVEHRAVKSDIIFSPIHIVQENCFTNNTLYPKKASGRLLLSTTPAWSRARLVGVQNRTQKDCDDYSTDASGGFKSVVGSGAAHLSWVQSCLIVGIFNRAPATTPEKTLQWVRSVIRRSGINLRCVAISSSPADISLQ